MGWLASLISSLSGLAQSSMNTASQAATNKANIAMNDATNKANIAMNDSTNRMNYRIAQQTNLANRQLSEYEWSKNLEMWNLQNEYNSPSAQMQRLKDAGINPNLALSNVSSGTATTLPKYQAAGMQGAVMTPSQARAYYKSAVQFDGITKAFSLLSAFQDLKGKELDNQSRGLDMQATQEAILSSQLNRLFKSDQNLRSWGLYNYDRQYRAHLVDKISNEVSMQRDLARKLEYDTNISGLTYQRMKDAGSTYGTSFSPLGILLNRVIGWLNNSAELNIPKL